MHWQWMPEYACWGWFRSLLRVHQGGMLIWGSGICCERWKRGPHIFDIAKLPIRSSRPYQRHQSKTSSKRIYQWYKQYFKYFNNNYTGKFIRPYLYILWPFSKPQKFCFYCHIRGHFLIICIGWNWINHQKHFMHSLSGKVLFHFYASQVSTSNKGNLEVWVAVILELLNLGEGIQKRSMGKKGSLRSFSPALSLRGFAPYHPFCNLIG